MLLLFEKLCFVFCIDHIVTNALRFFVHLLLRIHKRLITHTPESGLSTDGYGAHVRPKFAAHT